MGDLIAELRACGTDLAESAANEIERCHARLEIDHCFRMGPEPDLEMIRESVPFEKRTKFPDAIRCRDATIAAIEEDITRLRSLTAELMEALELAEYAIGNAAKPDSISDMDDLRAWAESFFLPAARAALSRARAKEDT